MATSQPYAHPYAFAPAPSHLPPTTPVRSSPPASSLPPLPSPQHHHLAHSQATTPYSTPAHSSAPVRSQRGESSPVSTVNASHYAWRANSVEGQQRTRGSSLASSVMHEPRSMPAAESTSPTGSSTRRQHRSRPSRSESSEREPTSAQPTTPTSSRTVLTIALQKAQSAVLLDGANNVPAAVAAYTESVRLLRDVMTRVEETSRRQREKDRLKEMERERDGESEEDRLRRIAKREQHERAKEDEAKRLRIIHDTYEDRIRMLLQNEAELAANTTPTSRNTASYPSPDSSTSPSTPRGSVAQTSSPPTTPRSASTSIPLRHRYGNSLTSSNASPLGPSPPPSPMDPMMNTSQQQQQSPPSPSTPTRSLPGPSPTETKFEVVATQPLQVNPGSYRPGPASAFLQRRPSEASIPELYEGPNGSKLSAHSADEEDVESQDDHAASDGLPEMAGYSSTSLDDRGEAVSSSEEDEEPPVTAYEEASSGWPSQRGIVDEEEDNDPYGGISNSPAAPYRPSSPPPQSLPPMPPSKQDPSSPLSATQSSVLNRPRPRPSRTASLAAQSLIRHSQSQQAPLVSSTTSLGTISQRRSRSPNHFHSASQGSAGSFWHKADGRTSPAMIGEDAALPLPAEIIIRPASTDTVRSRNDFGPPSDSSPPASSAAAQYSSTSLPSRLRALSQPGKRPAMGSHESAPALPRLNVLTPAGSSPNFARKHSVPTPTSHFPSSLVRSQSRSSINSSSERDLSGRTPSPLPYRASSSLSEHGTPVSAMFAGRNPPVPGTASGFSGAHLVPRPHPSTELPLAPIVPNRRPFHLMRQIATSIESGGYVTPKLYIPKPVWSQAGVKLVAIETKVRMLDHVLTGLEGLERAGEALLTTEGAEEGTGKFTRELEAFDGLSDGIQATLAKKLGYGPSGKKTSATSFSAWSSKLSRSLDRVTNGRSLDSPATYVEGISRVFKQSQRIDQHLLALAELSGGYAYLSPEQVRALDQRFRRISEFFGQVICQFVLRDLGILLDKYVKHGSSWATGAV